MNRPTTARTAASVCLLLALAGVLCAADIWTPRPHDPAFVEPGGSFRVELHAAAGLAASGWSASLANDLRSWPCTVTAAARSRIHHGTEDGWTIAIRAPADLPPELFRLAVTLPSGERLTSERAVRGVKRFDESFSILQVTDIHLADVVARQASGETHHSGNSSLDAMKWAAPVINLINPRVVIYTGDNAHIYYNATGWGGMDLSIKRLGWFKEGIAGVTTATAALTGNHDIGYSSYVSSREWRDTYERVMGRRCFSFRMGSFYTMAQEFSYVEYLDWARADWAAAAADPSITFRLLAQHYPDPWSDPFTAATLPPHLMIVGHSHSTRRIQTSPYPVLSTGPALDRQRAGFFSFRKTASGWTCPQATTHAEGGNVFRLLGDWGAPKVTIAWAHPNDGTRDANTATIRNDLPQDFPDGRVRFLLPRGSYSVTGGTIEASYDYADGTRTAVLVKATLPRQATATVTVARSATAAPPTITTQPTSVTVAVGERASFAVAATGSGPLTYAWRRDGGPVIGTAATLVIASAQAGDAGSYACTVANAAGTATSAAARLTVTTATAGGWQAVYHDNADFTGATVSRIDPVIAFDWGTGSPLAGIGAETFSVRWRGSLTPPADGEWTFTTTTDDGIRVWVDGQRIIDRWVAQAPTATSGRATLTAGRAVDVVVEYYEAGGGAVARLEWQGPGTARQLVPAGAVVPAQGLPAGWSTADLGAVRATGSATEAGGTWTVVGSGADIWGSADGGRLAWIPIDGDVVITARITGMTGGESWAKAGVMVRESSAPGARHAFACMTRGNGLAFQRRVATGGASRHTAGPAQDAPAWVRLERIGDMLIGSWSADGAAWHEIQRDTVPMAAAALAGLAVTAHADGSLCTATITDVRVVSAPRAAN